MAHISFPEIEKAKQTFGAAAGAYGRLINEIAPRLTRERYVFEDIAVFEQKARDPVSGRSYAGQIYWIEMLSRAHMAAVGSIFRTTRWADAAVREYSAGNLYGWASSCRSFIEAAGDSGHSLARVPLTLAQINKEILAELNGNNTEPSIISGELEDALIHFTHARKTSKHEAVPRSHKAMQSTEYIKFIEEMKIVGVREFYAYLCELVHPASDSLSTLFIPDEGVWVVAPDNERVTWKPRHVIIAI